MFYLDPKHFDTHDQQSFVETKMTSPPPQKRHTSPFFNAVESDAPETLYYSAKISYRSDPYDLKKIIKKC